MEVMLIYAASYTLIFRGKTNINSGYNMIKEYHFYIKYAKK